MKDTVIQCCYTNASHELGKNVVSGWQTVAVSPGMPADAYQKAVSYMNIHSSMQGKVKNEDGSDVKLIEIYGDGKYLYYIRTKYGLLDHTGRPNLFSHAYIFPWTTENMLFDPNVYLTIDAANFKDNEADALHIPREFIRTGSMNTLAEMRSINLSPNALGYIVRGIYAQMTDKTIHESLYIQFDGDERKMLGLIYCIYAVLPHDFARFFSISSDNGEPNRDLTVILSREARKHNYYLDPYLGEDNVIGPRLNNKLRRLVYVDFPALHVERYDPQIYMRNLEELVKWFGDSEPYDEYSFKMAHVKYFNELSKTVTADQCAEYITDALRAKKCQSAGMDKLLASIMERGVSCGMFIEEEEEFAITMRAYRHNSAGLINAMENYTVDLFHKLTTDQSARKLARMNDMLRERYISYFSFVDPVSGGEILDKYYTDYFVEYELLDEEKLGEVIEEIGDFAEKPHTKEKIYKAILELYKKQRLSGNTTGSMYVLFYEMVDKMEDDELNDQFRRDAACME